MYLEQPPRLPNTLIVALLGIASTLDLAPGPGGSRMSDLKDTQIFYQRPPLSDLLPGTWTYCTVIALYPSAQLVAHQDRYEIKGIRHHLPLQVNDGCWSFHEGVWQQLEVGKVYTMDPKGVHGAVNWGATLRLHLIVDVLYA